MANQRVIEVRERLKSLFSRYGTDGVPLSVVDEMEKLNTELETLTAASQAAEQRSKTEKMDEYWNAPASRPRQPGGNGGGSGGPLSAPYDGKSIGELFVESKAFRDYDSAKRDGPGASFEMKTVLTTTGWPPQSIRIPRIEPYPSRALRVIDVFVQGTTNQHSIDYLEETTFTNAAAETAEGSDKPASTLAFTPCSAPIRCIATYLPVTNPTLDDAVQARDYINGRLRYMVLQRLDSQVLVGDGVAPNLDGILNVAGIQTQAKGADPVTDAFYKAITLSRNSGYEPDAIIMHPNDWEGVRLLRTADGIYIYGNPFDSGPERMWGLPVVITTAITENTGLIGAFGAAAQLWFRSAVDIAVSDSHSDYFIKNQVCIRAEVRVGLTVYRPSSFVTVTGI